MKRRNNSRTESAERSGSSRHSDRKRDGNESDERTSHRDGPATRIRRQIGNTGVQRLVAQAGDRVPDPVNATETTPGIQRMCPRCRRRAREGKPLNCRECEAELQRSESTNPSGPRCIEKGHGPGTDELSMSEPGDQLEREAEAVASAVLEMPDPRTQRATLLPDGGTRAAVQRRLDQTVDAGGLQRMCERCSRRLAAGMKLNCSECERELQRESASDGSEADSGRTPHEAGNDEAERRKPTRRWLRAARGTGRPLSEPIRQSLEPRFGYDFSNVRVHTGPRATALSRSIDARAFTYGNHVFFGRGEYRPTTRRGRHLLAHELTHTIQQGAAAPLPSPASTKSGRGANENANGRPDWDASIPESGRVAGSSTTRTTVSEVQRAAARMGTVGDDDRGPATDRSSRSSERGEEQGWWDRTTETVGEAGTALWEWGESTVEETTQNLVDAALGQAQALAAALGARVYRSNGTIVIVASDVTIPSETNVSEISFPTISGELPFLKGGFTTDSLTLVGTASLATAFAPSVWERLGDAHLDRFRMVIDPLGPSVRSQGMLTVPTTVGLSAELRLGVSGDLRAIITIPGEPPIPVVLPSVGLTGGLTGSARTSADQEVSFWGSASAGLWNVSLDANQSWRSALDLDVGLAGYGALEIENVDLCRLYWPLWSSGVTATLYQQAGLSLEAGMGGFNIDPDQPTIDLTDVDTSELSDEAERNLFEDECPLCWAFRKLGWLPSQFAPLEKYYMRSPIGGPLEVYRWDPGFASGAKCRGACGPDCKYCDGPQTRVAYGVNGDGQKVVWQYDRFYACPTHAACRQHDACYDWTMGDTSIEGPFGIYGPLHRLCDLECICDHSLAQCGGWLQGQGGDAVMYFAEDVQGPVPVDGTTTGDGQDPVETADVATGGIRVCSRTLDFPGLDRIPAFRKIHHAFVYDPVSPGGPYTYAIRDLVAGNGITESCARKYDDSPPPDVPATSMCIPCEPAPGQTQADLSRCLRTRHRAYPDPNRYRNLPDPKDGFRPGPNSNSYGAELAVNCCANVGPSKFGPSGLGFLWGWNHSPAGPCRLPTQDTDGDPGGEPRDDGGASTAGTDIHGPDELWYFDGEDPPNYDVTDTLNSNRSAGTYRWTTSPELALSSATAASPDVTTRGSSRRPLDVWIHLEHTTPDGTVTTDQHNMTVFTAESLDHLRNNDNADPNWGYETFVHYRILDQFGDTLPEDVPINEQWTSGITVDFNGMNWRRGPEGWATVSPADWADHIQGENTARHNVPAPVGPGHPNAGVRVYHWDGDWYVGSSTIGDGSLVASVTWQKQRGNARHV